MKLYKLTSQGTAHLFLIAVSVVGTILGLTYVAVSHGQQHCATTEATCVKLSDSLVSKKASPASTLNATSDVPAQPASVVATSPTLSTSAATKTAPAICKDVEVTAHRGGTLGLDAIHTEDSLDSFKDTAALATKAAKNDIVVTAETDIWRTKPISGSGTWINNHDATLNRTTTGKGYIANQQITQLTNVHYNDGEPLTRFATAVRYMASVPAAHFQVELKPDPVSLGSLKALSGKVIESHMQDRFEFTSFNADVLKELYSLHTGIKIGYLASTPVDLNDAKTFANDVLYSTDLATPANIAAAHAVGLKVGVWTLDSQSGWVKYLNNGVDIISTDEATTYYNWCTGSHK